MLDGDEDMEVGSEPVAFAKKIWDFRIKIEKGAVKIFKAPLGRHVYRPHPFTCLGEMMKSKPILPKQDIAYLPQFTEGEQAGESFEQASALLQSRLCASESPPPRQIQEVAGIDPLRKKEGCLRVSHAQYGGESHLQIMLYYIAKEGDAHVHA